MIVAIWVPGRPATLNAERRNYWREHRESTRVTREAAHIVSNRLPKVDNGFVVATPWLCQPLPDPGNNYPTVKAALDGMVDAGVLGDDKWPHVRGILMLPPNLVPGAANRAPHEGLLIGVNTVEAASHCILCGWEMTVHTGRGFAVCGCAKEGGDYASAPI